MQKPSTKAIPLPCALKSAPQNTECLFKKGPDRYTPFIQRMEGFASKVVSGITVAGSFDQQRLLGFYPVLFSPLVLGGFQGSPAKMDCRKGTSLLGLVWCETSPQEFGAVFFHTGVREAARVGGSSFSHAGKRLDETLKLWTCLMVTDPFRQRSLLWKIRGFGASCCDS